MAIRNPPFDRRIWELPGIAGAPGLYRGKLVSMPNSSDPDFRRARWICYFLYNPSTIELSHATTADMLVPEDRAKFDLSQYEGDTASSVSWSLLFDRTYETWDKKYRTRPEGQYGVYTDVRTLYGMVGMVPRTGGIKEFDIIRGPMVAKPVQVYFGATRSLTYYGRIESLGVTYTHWTTKMVPNRCVVNLNLKIYPKGLDLQYGANVSRPDSDSHDRSSRGGTTPQRRRERTLPAPRRLPSLTSSTSGAVTTTNRSGGRGGYSS